jgi:hypothetical protein
MLGVIAVSLAFKQIFGIPYWRTGVLLWDVSLAWFMHSRTKFEAPAATALYALFLYGYMLYLYRSPRYFPFVLVTSALTFHSYNPTRVVVAASVALLFISDLRYRWENRGTILRYWWLVVLCGLPFLRFQILHPMAGLDQLHLLNAYWIQPIELSEKLSRLGNQFIRGLSPFYWFVPQEQGLIRHTMRGYGRLLWIALPFMLAGLIVALKKPQAVCLPCNIDRAG